MIRSAERRPDRNEHNNSTHHKLNKKHAPQNQDIMYRSTWQQAQLIVVLAPAVNQQPLQLWMKS